MLLLIEFSETEFSFHKIFWWFILNVKNELEKN